jgi:hypothetical protein
MRQFCTLVLVLTLAVAAGCGEAPPTAGRGGGSVDLLFGDCSSFRRYTQEFVPEMLAVAVNSARVRHVLWAACFDGAPMRTLEWSAKVDFGDLPKEVRHNPRLADQYNLARALGLRRQLYAMVANTPERAPGSGQLEALEVAAQTPGLARVFMWTDGAINEVDGVKLKTATRTQLEQTVLRWAPRLRGLSGADLHLIGVGRGTQSTSVVRNAEILFHELAQRDHARAFGWTLELPARLRRTAS